MSQLPSIPRSEQTVARMFDEIAGSYDFLNRLLSARRDLVWRKALVKRTLETLPQNSNILDIATGTGDVILQILKTAPTNTYCTGIDISPAMLALAEKKLKQTHHKSACKFLQMSGQSITLPSQSFDAVTISFGIRNIVDKPKALAECYRILKPGGRLAILELYRPRPSPLASIFEWYFSRVLPKIGAIFGLKDAYRYLPESVFDFYTLDQMLERITQAGFTVVGQKTFKIGNCSLIWSDKKPLL